MQGPTGSGRSHHLDSDRERRDSHDAADGAEPGDRQRPHGRGDELGDGVVEVVEAPLACHDLLQTLRHHKAPTHSYRVDHALPEQHLEEPVTGRHKVVACVGARPRRVAGRLLRRRRAEALDDIADSEHAGEEVASLLSAFTRSSDSLSILLTAPTQAGRSSESRERLRSKPEANS